MVMIFRLIGDWDDVRDVKGKGGKEKCWPFFYAEGKTEDTNEVRNVSRSRARTLFAAIVIQEAPGMQ